MNFEYQLSEEQKLVIRTLIEDDNTIDNSDLVNYMNQLLDRIITPEFKKEEIYKLAMEAFTTDGLNMIKVIREKKLFNEIETIEESFIAVYEMLIAGFNLWNNGK